MRVPFARSSLLIGMLAAQTLWLQAPAVQAQTSAMLEEVLVTARKREESLQAVPVAVTAFSANQLQEAGISNIQDLSAPGLQIDSNSSAQIWIRGMGQRDDSARIDSPVGVYVDGVYIARRDAQLLDMLDPESIQVLRGPQGTLFGKNTTGGALLVDTAKPNADFGGYVQGRVGNYDRRDGKVVLNLPLIDDTLYSKVSIASTKRDGYQDNLTTGQTMASEDRLSTSLQLRWLASDSVTVDTFAYYNKTREVPSGAACQWIENGGYQGQQALYQNTLWAGDTVAVWPLEGLGINAQTASFITGLPMAEVSPTFRDACLSSQARINDDKVTSDAVQKFDLDNLLVGVTVHWDISDTLSFKSITGYGDQKLAGISNSADNDGAPGHFSSRYRMSPSERQQMSQEFQFNGSLLDGRLNYTAGLFGMVEDIDDGTTYQFRGMSGFFIPAASLFGSGPIDIVTVQSPTTQHDTYELKNTTLAAFLQGSYDITPELQLTLGLRWTSEKRDTDLVQRGLDRTAFNNLILANIPGTFSTGTGIAYPAAMIPMDILGQIQALFPIDAQGAIQYPLGAPVRHKASKTWNQVTPMASLSYRLPDAWVADSFIDNAMFYFTYSEGFKSGTFEPFGSQGLRAVDPETVKNFELGVKLDGFDRRVRLNTAIYHMKYDDMQLRQVQYDNASPVVVLANASKSEITGIEMELTWQPIEGLLINAGASYNNYEFKEFEDVQFSTYHLLTQQPLPTVDRSSEKFPEVSQKTFDLGIQYSWHTDIGTLRPRIDYRYNSEIYMGLEAGAWGVRKQTSIPSFHVVNARLSWVAPDETWEVAAFATNLTNEKYLFGAAATADSIGTFITQKAPPRMYGLEFLYRFGNY